MTKKIATVLILLMALLQGFYAMFAYIDPLAFAGIRGTDLVALADQDWVRIYASRTLFVSLVVGFLLFKRQFQILIWVSLFGLAMPLTDAWLASEAGAPASTVYKHVATALYLIATIILLSLVAKKDTAD